MAIIGRRSPLPSNPANDRSTAALRADLGLADGRCGCPRKSDRQPCCNPIPAASRPALEDLLDRLLDRTQSDTALRTDLELLAQTVHCHWHDKLGFNSARADAWIKVFPEGVTHDLQPRVASVLRQAFGAPSRQCAATTNKGTRCKKHIGGQKVQIVLAATEAIKNPANYAHPAKLEVLLHDLDESRFCDLVTHRGDAATVREAKECILDLWPSAIRLALTHEDFNHSLTRKARLRVSSETFSSDDSDDDASSGRPRGRARSLQRSPSPEPGIPSLVLVRLDTTPLKVVEEAPTALDSNVLRELLLTELDPTNEVKEGFVYCYSVAGNPGVVKIGFTTRSVQDREKEWQFDCNRHVKMLYPLEHEDSITVPHAKRVEALCHAELAAHRLKVDCIACFTRHEEYFRVDSKTAIATIRKWSRWMNHDPYLESASGSWSLKREWQRKVADMEDFLAALAADSSSVVQGEDDSALKKDPERPRTPVRATEPRLEVERAACITQPQEDFEVDAGTATGMNGR